MSRKATKKTHDLPTFEINDKMKTELDDDDESTLYEEPEALGPPYSEYGIMDNYLNNLPKSFFEPATSVS